MNLQSLQSIAETEFSDIVSETLLHEMNELRIFLVDGSFVDVWYSLKLHERYSYHWERRALDGTIYRHDNAPHRKWRCISTFPRHFHDGSEDKVIESHISGKPEQALRDVLGFVRDKLSKS